MNKEKENGFFEKLKQAYPSIREHLSPEYRTQFIIRRAVSCFLLYIVLSISIAPNGKPTWFIPLVWAIIAWIFWHYSFWSFQGGAIDTISQSIIHFGSIWGIIGKLILQNLLIITWIALIAPFSGMITWRKAVKTNDVLFMTSKQKDKWV